MTQKKPTFIVVSPPYSARSGGIMVLHQLCTELNRVGYKAGLVLITEGSQAAQGFKFGYSINSSFLDPGGVYHDFFTNQPASKAHDFIANSIAIYPDIIIGNPLNSRAFCTYVLGVPKYDIVSQYIIRFSKLFIDKYDFTLHKSFIDPCMNDHDTRHWTERELNITYIGKGRDFLDCRTIPGTVLIERDWPQTKQELAILLKNCKFFFSWDCISATNSDSVLCGAVPVLMHDLQLPRTTINKGEYGELPIVENPLSLLNKLSKKEEKQINTMLIKFKSKMLSYCESWNKNVKAFAFDVSIKLP